MGGPSLDHSPPASRHETPRIHFRAPRGTGRAVHWPPPRFRSLPDGRWDRGLPRARRSRGKAASNPVTIPPRSWPSVAGSSPPPRNDRRPRREPEQEAPGEAVRGQTLNPKVQVGPTPGGPAAVDADGPRKGKLGSRVATAAPAPPGVLPGTNLPPRGKLDNEWLTTPGHESGPRSPPPAPGRVDRPLPAPRGRARRARIRGRRRAPPAGAFRGPPAPAPRPRACRR